MGNLTSLRVDGSLSCSSCRHLRKGSADHVWVVQTLTGAGIPLDEAAHWVRREVHGPFDGHRHAEGSFK